MRILLKYVDQSYKKKPSYYLLVDITTCKRALTCSVVVEMEELSKCKLTP
jgi:hypothetical protein